MNGWTAQSALLLLLILACLGLDRGLWTPDEPREAEIGREMMLTPGIIPTLNGSAFVEKPPLYYWIVAGAYRLAGGASPVAARAVSATAGFLSLLVVFSWGRRAHSIGAGLIASVMLATAFQFGLSTHWVLMDPLLMLFTTLAAWAGWELVRGHAGWGPVTGFYLAVALALWTKGLIGPVLIGAGLGAYLVMERRSGWRPLRPGFGSVAMAAAVAGMVAAMYVAGGREAVYEWGWVNQVLRFLQPQGTGHERPFHYYLWTLPFTMLPWLVPLTDILRPARWRSLDGADLYRYCVLMSAGMLLVLSAAATKRGIYLLPVLPLLFMAAAINVLRWWSEHGQKNDQRNGLGRAWSLQAILLGVYVVAPPLAAIVYLRRAEPAALVALVAAIAACVALLVAYRRRRAGPALATLAACALIATASSLVLVPRVLDDEKDMAPFVAWVDQQLPVGELVYAIGADETLRAIVPFVTSRTVVVMDPDALAVTPSNDGRPPAFVLVQSKNSRSSVIRLGPTYRVIRSRTFGPDRHLALWQRRPDAPPT